MKKIFFLVLAVFSLMSYSQRIQNFHTFLGGTNVGIRFTITKGPQCSGYTIYHSLDSINYIQIYDYPGVCGDMNVNQEISYTHSSPAFNQVNYYRVELVPFESSPVSRIYVTDQVRSSMLVYPNPVTQTSDLLSLKFFNASNIRVIGFLFNQYGKPLRELDIKSNLDRAETPVYDLANGLYVLWLSDGINVFSSKFIVNR